MGSAPRLHGKPVPHAPLPGTKMRPTGVTSSTTTSAASDGPGFVTVMVNATVVPAVTLGGPVFAIRTSAAASIAVVSVALLLSATGSVVPSGAATVAVLLSVPVALAITVPVAVKVTDAPA